MIFLRKGDTLHGGGHGSIEQLQLDVAVTPPHQLAAARVVHPTGEKNRVLVFHLNGLKSESPSTSSWVISAKETWASTVIWGDIMRLSTMSKERELNRFAELLQVLLPKGQPCSVGVATKVFQDIATRFNGRVDIKPGNRAAEPEINPFDFVNTTAGR